MSSQPPILTYASPKPDGLLRWLLWLTLAEIVLVVAAVGTGIGGDVYDRLHPMSGRGARVSTPIYNGLFLAAGLIWLVILPLVVAAVFRHRPPASHWSRATSFHLSL